MLKQLLSKWFAYSAHMIVMILFIFAAVIFITPGAVYASSLIQNPGFEDDLTGWTTGGTAPGAKATGAWPIVYNEANSFKMLSSSAYTSSLETSLSNCNAGPYTATVWVRSDGTWTTAKFQIYQNDVLTNEVNITPSSTWTQYVINDINMTTNATVKIRIYVDANANAWLYFDNFELIEDLTDEKFFGVWDSGTSSWTTAGKINYSYSTGLAAVENAVKSGNYENAKTELLNYYKNRTSRTVEPIASGDASTANLACDNILSGYDVYYSNTFTVNNNFQTVQADVTNDIINAYSENKQVTFQLMARTKEESLAEFNSRESTNNKPQLEVTVNGVTQTLTAVKDTYVRPGIYGDTNYGASTLLYAEDWGVPFNDDTRRMYMQFDLSDLTGVPTSASLKLYGRNTSGTGNKDVMVFRILNTIWDETAFTWNNALGNTFSWQGIDEGPDWNQPLSGADKEYMWTVTRFGFALPMVYEYNQTSNETYAGNLLRLMQDFMNDKVHLYPRSLDTGIRAYFWVRAYHYIRNSTSMDSAQNTEMLKNLWQTADWLAYNPNGYSAMNWAISETRGLYIIAVYFPEFISALDWQSVSNSRLDNLMKTLNYIDGSYAEASSMYTNTAAHNFYSIKKIGELNNQTFSPAFDLGMEGMGKYMMNYTFPNGYDPQYGDADYIDYKPFVLDIGNSYNNGSLIYFGSDGTSGTAPSNTSMLYPEYNDAIMRTGWQDNDLYMNTNNNTGSHGHGDQLSITAYAYGRPLLVDPGRYSYSSEASASWLKTVEAHNTIQINDTNQSGANVQSDNNNQSIDSWVTNGYYDFFEANTSLTPGFTHYRSVLFIKPSYWIVSDYVKGGGAGTNKYEQNWHMLPMASLTLDTTTKKASTNFGDTNGNIQVVPADPSSITALITDGYYSSLYMSITPAKYVSYTKNTSGDTTFDTILYPTASGDTRDVRVTRLTITPDTDTTIATALKLDFNYNNGANTGYYYLSHETSPWTARTFDEFNFNGKMAYVEKDSSNNLVSAAVKSGRTLKRNGADIIRSAYEIKDIAITWNGTTLEIVGDSLTTDTDAGTAIAINASSATSVKLNGSLIPYTKIGDYVYAVRQKKVECYTTTSDFCASQGNNDWYYMKYTGSKYVNLPMWVAAGSSGETSGSDTFSSSTLGSQWSWVREDNTKWSLTANPGHLQINTSSGDVWIANNNEKNILLQTPQYKDYTITTKLNFSPVANSKWAGLIIYVDDDNYISLVRSYQGGNIFSFVKEIAQSGSKQTIIDTLGATVYLRIKKVGLDYTGYYSSDGTDWIQVGTWTNIPFSEPKVGLHASHNTTSITADFDNFDVAEFFTDRWTDTDGSKPAIAQYFSTTDTAEDSVRKWIAPAAGVVHIFGTVSSYSAYTTGDGFNARILKNTSSIWPASGWQLVARDDTAGCTINETVQVNAGDDIFLIINKNTDITNDFAKWDVKLAFYPDATLFYDDFQDGNSGNWTPLTPSRWTVGLDGGDYSYGINTSDYSPQSGDRPGEYSLIDGSNYDNFKINLKARQGDDVGTNSTTDFTVLFNYKDSNNYYYAMFNNTAVDVQLFKVKAGVRQLIANSNETDWIKDNSYHSISIERNGITGSITVLYDNDPVFMGYDTEFIGGQVGIGSYDDSAYFDEISVINLDTGTDTFNSSTLSSQWSWVRENDTNWGLAASPECMRITTSYGDLWIANNNEGNILLQTPQYGDYTITTKLTFSPTANVQSAGLIAYSDDDNYIKVERLYNNGNFFRIVKEAYQVGSKQTLADTLGGTVYLKLVKSGTSYSGYYSSDGSTWTQIGTTYTDVVFPSDPRVGICAQHSGSAPSKNADFDYFDIVKYIPCSSDTFTSTTLDNGKWNWVRENNAKWSLTANLGYMRITTSSGDVWIDNSSEENILLQTPQYGDYTITTKLSFSPTANVQSAGLIAYSDDDNYIKVERTYGNGNFFSIIKETGQVGSKQIVADTLGTTVYLKLVKSGTSYSGYYSSDGSTWTQIGTTYTDVVFPSNPCIGIRAQHSGAAPSINADFDDFDIIY